MVCRVRDVWGHWMALVAAVFGAPVKTVIAGIAGLAAELHWQREMILSYAFERR